MLWVHNKCPSWSCGTAVNHAEGPFEQPCPDLLLAPGVVLCAEINQSVKNRNQNFKFKFEIKSQNKDKGSVATHHDAAALATPSAAVPSGHPALGPPYTASLWPLAAGLPLHLGCCRCCSHCSVPRLLLAEPASHVHAFVQHVAHLQHSTVLANMTTCCIATAIRSIVQHGKFF